MYILYSISASFKLSVSSTIQTSPMLNCGTHCHPLLSLNPTICHLLNLTSTNLILSPFLLKLPFIFSVFPLSGLCYRPYSLSPTLLTKIKTKIPYSLSPIVVLLHIFPFPTAIFTDIALWKSRISFLIQ